MRAAETQHFTRRNIRCRRDITHLLARVDLLGARASNITPDFDTSRRLTTMVKRVRSRAKSTFCYDQCLREDVRIDGTDTLVLYHLYRAMDMLEAHKQDIEQALYFRLADPLNLDVELIFYDKRGMSKSDRSEPHRS